MAEEKRQRDSKGRFVKGNKEGQKFTAGGSQTETARLGAIASNEVQRRKRLLREVLREELDKETAQGSGVTKMEAVVAAVVQNEYKKASAKGLKILTEILGEMEVNINVRESHRPLIKFSKKSDE